MAEWVIPLVWKVSLLWKVSMCHRVLSCFIIKLPMCYGYVKSLQGPKGAHELEIFILLVNILIGDDINKIGYTTQRAYNIHIYIYVYILCVYIYTKVNDCVFFSEGMCFAVNG